MHYLTYQLCLRVPHSVIIFIILVSFISLSSVKDVQESAPIHCIALEGEYRIVPLLLSSLSRVHCPIYMIIATKRIFQFIHVMKWRKSVVSMSKYW
jgi:hypothetical protein